MSSKFKIKDIGLEYKEKDGIFYPKLEEPIGRVQLSITARRAVDMLNEMSPTALDMVNVSGLCDRIWEEIAERVTDKETEVMEAMRKSLPKELKERVRRETEIRIEAERQGNELMTELVKQLRIAAMTLPHLSDVGQWQLP